MASYVDHETKRIIAVDIARGIAVLCMMLVHTLWMYASIDVQSTSVLGNIIHFIGKGTPVFLLCMGISFTLSKRQNLSAVLSRGMLILGFAYFMNFMKFVVPISIFGTMPESFVQAYGWNSPLQCNQLIHLLLTGDILQLAGLSLLILALLRHFVSNKYIILLLAFVVLAISKEISGYMPGVAGFDYIASLFFSDNYHVYFPVFPWFSFILFGMYLGMCIREHNGAHSKVLSSVWLSGVLPLIIGASLCVYNMSYHFGDFFHLGPGGVLSLLGLNVIFLWAIHKTVEVYLWPTALNFLSYCSQRVTSLYIIQWILICWGMGVVGFQTLNAIETSLMMPVVVVFTFLIQICKERCSNWFRTQILLAT